KLGYSKITIGHWKRRGVLPAEIAKKMLKSNAPYDTGDLWIKSGKNSTMPVPLKVEMDSDFLVFAGLWLADGCYDRNSVIISVVEEENREIVRRVARKFRLKCKMHSDGFSLMIHSKSLKSIMKNVLKLEGNSYTKKMPAWVFMLSKKQMGSVLRGLFSGDGCASDKEITMALASQKLIRDVQTMLLHFGVIIRINKLRKDKTRHCNISSLKSLRVFRSSIGFLTKKKTERLNVLCSKKSTHDTSDVIPLSLGTKRRLAEVCRIFNKQDYINRNNNIGREHLKKIIAALPKNETELIKELDALANSDIYWDRIVNIKSFRKSQHVYDFSVPGYENFISNNILAHNTLELPMDSLRALNYNVTQLKSRSVITQVETEMPADEALRTALRLGDSALIVGEVRSLEAKALYEAMRIGALSNVVAGTIHGESAYGVFDRVVNDLEVPKTSFKATDIIPICKMLRSADGLHRFRRMTEITEVRKEWSDEPVKEGGFVNLMEYSGKEDRLKPTDTLLNGESEILNRIASNVREWSGNWEAVWENINLRAKMKAEMLRLSEQLKKPGLIEADWVVHCNQQYHLIEEKVREEIGHPDPSRVWEDWKRWFTVNAMGKK
ncbi:MAG: Flp pilus assembly complex ATPase component TadA, partial [Candidatus Aenigmarchaeota archaeon]|nr:Flp pilus assembly complex ATPase component TadA [Candidatus Aenigmarchaeota archaeon]